MVNKDNKTKTLKEVKLTKYKMLIEKNPIHIATVNKFNKPNLSVASDVKVLDDKTILISNNEMIHTPQNILINKEVVLTSFSDKWAGLRLTGIAKYYTTGQYFKICNELFKNDDTTPKGAILIKVKKAEGIA